MVTMPILRAGVVVLAMVLGTRKIVVLAMLRTGGEMSIIATIRVVHEVRVGHPRISCFRKQPAAAPIHSRRDVKGVPIEAMTVGGIRDVTPEIGVQKLLG